MPKGVFKPAGDDDDPGPPPKNTATERTEFKGVLNSLSNLKRGDRSTDEKARGLVAAAEEIIQKGKARAAKNEQNRQNRHK